MARAAAPTPLRPSSARESDELDLLSRTTTDDKKVKLTVLMSTNHAAPHIASCTASAPVWPDPEELQPLLMSAVSVFIFCSSCRRSPA